MIVHGGGSRTVYATYRSRARLPTPPRSDDESKDEELSNNHEFQNSNISVGEPVLLTPPGSAKTSIDLPTKSSHKLLSNVDQSVLGIVKSFFEAQPTEPLVT
jgi:hypothetical protein